MERVDWAELRRLVDGNDVTGLVQALRVYVLDKRYHFKGLRQGLQANCLAQVRNHKLLRPCSAILKRWRMSLYMSNVFATGLCR